MQFCVAASKLSRVEESECQKCAARSSRGTRGGTDGDCSPWLRCVGPAAALQKAVTLSCSRSQLTQVKACRRLPDHHMLARDSATALQRFTHWDVACNKLLSTSSLSLQLSRSVLIGPLSKVFFNIPWRESQRRSFTTFPQPLFSPMTHLQRLQEGKIYSQMLCFS